MELQLPIVNLNLSLDSQSPIPNSQFPILNCQIPTKRTPQTNNQPSNQPPNHPTTQPNNQPINQVEEDELNT